MGPHASFLDCYGAQLRRHPGRLVGAIAATAVGVLVAGLTDANAFIGALSPGSRSGAAAASSPGPPDAWTVSATAAASTCPGLPPSVLLAIADMETERSLGAGVSTAGALGPMQFLPATWAAYGTDGNGDGVADVSNLDDALHGAARLLCANGAGDPARLRSAVWNYNHSPAYVDQVLERAGLRHS